MFCYCCQLTLNIKLLISFLRSCESEFCDEYDVSAPCLHLTAKVNGSDPPEEVDLWKGFITGGVLITGCLHYRKCPLHYRGVLFITGGALITWVSSLQECPHFRGVPVYRDNIMYIVCRDSSEMKLQTTHPLHPPMVPWRVGKGEDSSSMSYNLLCLCLLQVWVS